MGRAYQQTKSICVRRFTQQRSATCSAVVAKVALNSGRKHQKGITMLDDTTLLALVSGTAFLCAFTLYALVVETVRLWRPKPRR
jgi:hypothetical protein